MIKIGPTENSENKWRWQQALPQGEYTGLQAGFLL
jgi:hypothetical protein